MMKYLKILIAIISSFSLFNCEKDAEMKTKEYPFVITNSPTVYEDGVEFSADLTNPGNQKILKYGFVWSEKSNPTIQNEYKMFYEEPQKGIYSLNVKSGLSKGQTYYVRAYILTNQYEVLGSVKSFTSLGSLPPIISNFTPKYGPIGTQVIIEGQNFALSKTGNVIKFGNTKAVVDSVSENKLIVTVPQITKPESVPISIQTAGMEVTSNSTFDLWFPWLKKKDFSAISYYTTSFSIGNIGYVINNNSTTMLTYNPENDEWKSNIILPENSGSMPMAFELNGLAYVLLNNNLWEYNTLSNTWKKKKQFPGTLQDDRMYAFGMKIGSNLYVGNCYRTYEFWEYNPNLDSWQRKADFAGNFGQINPVWGHYSFSLNNKGFLGISQTGFAINTLWEYDPQKNLWTGKSPLPSDAYSYYCSFVIGDDAFVGLGHNFDWGVGYVSNKLWKYDFQNNRWINYRDCPVGMDVFASFSINNKGYIASGSTKYSEPLRNIWEFDPTKN